MINRNIANPRMRELVQQLVAREAAADSISKPTMPVVFRVIEALRRPLSTLAGVGGFRALLARALALTEPRFPGLGAVQVQPDGSLEGLTEPGTNHDGEAGIVLIAQLLGLLAAFIGESLTLRILLDVWPDLTVLDAGPYGESEHDSTR